MRTLKESILSRSSHGAKGFEDQRREMIEKWLDKYNIENYTINDDFTIDVNGSVYLNDQNLKEFPDYIQFGVVWKSFNCNNNYLTSLRGVPREVKWGFYCAFNKLTSLEGAPEKVGRDFDCSYNRLTSLKGAPREVGGSFDCSNNELTTLEGAPKKAGSLDCRYNSVQFTEEDVRRVCDVKGRINV